MDRGQKILRRKLELSREFPWYPPRCVGPGVGQDRNFACDGVAINSRGPPPAIVRRAARVCTILFGHRNIDYCIDNCVQLVLLFLIAQDADNFTIGNRTGKPVDFIQCGPAPVGYA